jgi:HTH-type transcriptional regulator / antitoxin HigA
MAAEPGIWQHDWTVAPGEILLEAIQERDMSQSELARRMDRPIKTINEIVNGKAAITPDTAIQLELTLGVAASFWNSLEATYRAQLARARSEEELQAYGSWAAAFPIKDLIRHKLIERRTSEGGTVAALLAYFRVSNPSAWEKHWLAPAASFRASPTFASSPYAAAAWLRWGEIVAAGIETEPFDSQHLRDVLDEIRAMTRRDFALVRQRIQGLLASAGVAFVLTPELPGTRLSGAARWLGADKAMIQLSLRHKTDDHLWFSLFHEARHLLCQKRVDFVDDDADSDTTDQDELDADCFARDQLIPPSEYADFVAERTFTSKSVRDFAKRQNVAVGIVVGRLQRDGHLNRSHLNELKRAVRVGGIS